MDDFQSNGDADINLDDDDDDMFKSARALEPEPEKRDANMFEGVNSGTNVAVMDNVSPDMTVDREIPLEDEDEKPFQVIQMCMSNMFTKQLRAVFILLIMRSRKVITWSYGNASQFVISITSVLVRSITLFP